MENFRKLGLNEAIIKALEEHKFTEPTEIQEKTIPLVLAGKDIIAGSMTGSGKTLAFGSGIIQNLHSGKRVQALVLVPTRELAEQVSKSLQNFSSYKELKITAVYGGVVIEPQISSLRTADVVIGTPGRILDHLQRNTIFLGNIKILVLDEADRMLDMGFIYDVEKIINQCPKNRQTMLFSATISSDIDHLAKKYMINPILISAESYIDPSLLEQVYYDVPDNQKFSLLVYLLKQEKAKLVMVFCNTQKNTDFVANNLQANGIESMAIHGGFSQAKRNHVMEQFHNQDVRVLVCTDVAARGLDIKGVSHVYNYDLPADSKSYIHRIGRTARAGNEGKAVSILASRDYDNFRQVTKDPELNIVNIPVPENIPRIFIRYIPEKRSFRPHGEYGSRNYENRRSGRSYGRGQSRGFRPRSSAGNNSRNYSHSRSRSGISHKRRY